MLAIPFLALLLFAADASAAEISFVHEDASVGDEFEVRVFLDASDDAINAIEGTFVFPENIEIGEIRDGNSLVVFWIERPHQKENMIRFSGIIPDGYSQRDASLFSVVFSATREGSGTFDVRNAHALLNDGLGTPANLTVSRSEILIGEQSGEPKRVTTLEDTEPPESFRPEIAQSVAAESPYFVVFATQDKLSGIDSYAVHESRWNIFWVNESAWNTAESPYTLGDQSLRSFVYVRATDKAGNTRTEMLWPLRGTLWQFLVALGLLSALGVSAILLYKYYVRRLRSEPFNL